MQVCPALRADARAEATQPPVAPKQAIDFLSEAIGSMNIEALRIRGAECPLYRPRDSSDFYHYRV